MKEKRIAAALTAFAMSVSILTFNQFNTNRAESSGKTVNVLDDKAPDMDVTATNSVGRYITQLSMQEEQDRITALDDYKDNYIIANLAFNPESGIAIVKTTQSVDCTIVLQIVDENNNSNRIVTKQFVQAGDDVITEVKVNIANLPEYYLVTADLVGLMDTPLCPTFTFSDYTREMQEIYAADIFDFEPEYVVNFDNDESTNFLVLNEATVIAESSEDVNTLVSADYDNGIYVFNHADDMIENLKPNDYFFIYANETDAIAISVDNVIIDGDTATVTAADCDIDNMFDFMKFEASADTTDAIVSMENADDSVSFGGYYSDTNAEPLETEEVYFEETKMLSLSSQLSSVMAKEAINAETGVKISFPVEYEKGALTLKGNADIGFDLKFNFYKRFDYVNVNFTLSFPQVYSVSAEVKASTNDSLAIPLGEIDIPTEIPGCYVKLQPKLVIEISASASVSVTYSMTPKIGISYDSDVDDKPHFVSSDGAPEETVSFEAEGKIFAGLDFDPKIVVLSESLATLTAEAKIGVQLTGKLETNLHSDGSVDSNIIVTDTTGNSVHACNTCIDGDIAFIIEGSVSLKLLVMSAKANVLKVNIPLGDWYWSDQLGFGWGTCPNLAYKVSFNVYDADGNPLSQMNVNINNVNCGITNSSGNAYLFCKDGTYDYYIGNEFYSYGGSVTINKGGKTINLKISDGELGLSSTSDIKVTTPSDGVKPTITNDTFIEDVSPKIAIVESGVLGDNIHYIIYADGFMLVYGSGEMYDGGYNYQQADIVTEVSVENIDANEYITNIGGYSFAGLKNMTKIELPDTITSIGDYAFEDCSNIKTISIPSKVKSIGNSAFSGCGSLTDISIPSSVMSLGANAFNECKSFTNVTIPGTVKNIGSGLFSNCTALKKVVISDGVENIDDHIFENCNSLQKITLPYAGHSASRVASNEDSMLATSYFSYDVTNDTYDVNSYGVPNSLKSVTITGGVGIPSYAFANMNSLTEIKLPNTVTVIYNNAFDSCTGLARIDFIPSSVKSIGDEAFARCSNAITAFVPDGTLTIGMRTFAECTSLDNIALPSTLTTIGERAFEECSRLQGISIPEGVTAIGTAAFSKCTAIEKITIPGNVKSIGDNMLINCTGLKDAKIENGVSNIGSWIFDGCVSLEKITLPYAGQSEASVAANTENPIAQSLFWYSLSEDAYSVNGWGVPYTLKSIVITGGACIPSYAFYGLSSVNEITIYGSATVIHNNAFEGCSGLTTISIPEKVEFLESGAFANCTSLSEIKFYNPSITLDTYSETIPRVATIYGWNDSTAQKYAEDYNRKFVSLGDYLTAPTLIGDCNLDGAVNVEDAYTLQDYLLARYTFTREAWLNADINKDGSADVFDLGLLKRMLINS